jgi:phenylpyruvate tautomerase PptA (4-oxalocrotonate tautomerase family)
MPVVTITGPSGLTKVAKKELIEGILHVLAETIYLPDDRVYIHEVPVENVGHTPLLEVTHGESWAVQSEAARIFVEVTAPPGLPIETKRKLMRGLTEVAGRSYGRSDLRNVLVSLDEHLAENFASNGFLQTENPDMEPFAATLRRTST